MYTFRVEESSAGNIEVYIDLDGKTIYYQPHHPSAEDYSPWSNEQDALDWATEFAYKLNNPEPSPEKIEIE